MNTFSIDVELLTGRYVAADVANRETAEWPPHPGRLFMAMAATCFEMGEDAADVAALQWLEQLPPPDIFASDGNRRSRHAVYVPVNDKVTASKSLLQTAPGLSRSKQERAFPTMIPDDATVTFVWHDVEHFASHLDGLQRICSNVIRVGHSSSLVRAWAQIDAGTPNRPRWEPTRRGAEVQLRIAGEGEFERLRIACGADRIDRFADLAETISSSKGTQKRKAKATFELEFGMPFKSSLRPPEPTPPVLGQWQGYARDAGPTNRRKVVEGEHFDSQLLVFRKLDGPNLGVQDSLALTKRLRDAAMANCEIQPPPVWLSGHEANGNATTDPHAAFVALPYAGGQYGDGHLMGLAIALPKQIAPETRGEALRGLLLDKNDDERPIELKLGNLGVWTLCMESEATAAKTLQNATWTRPSSAWASVTPVVLDRYPKSDRSTDRMRWNAEAAETIALACKRAGLPTPSNVEIDTTSWHRGVPRAVSKRRRLRGDSEREATTRLGDGFMPMPSRAGKPTRPQVHARIEFHDQVTGPVILGAGRFSGYGLCKPIHDTSR
ncbi:CRISPR-associated protein, family (Cas_GSU0054) [Rosistilla ulvae]|uniref:CRISPR-associated protein, family (Cas_GSU0054) n=1 Tax=Rosistilla ulvae TaxID=1930277 RepID=A0A517LTH8_9BACT|nr:type I-U CRISPR-associated protein Csb2 [Rosistilla ulvae]QDS85930.1 CRISPR-associated protein, family (Cas_GSU0054) [Rosistilla ulvae]